jgi:FtsH-binding integral membrane protein
MSPRSASPWRVYIFVAVLIVILAAAAIAMTESEDGSIGGGLLLFVLVIAGLPWSIVAMVFVDGNVAAAVMYAALALVNLGLLVWLRSRDTRPAPTA